MSANTNHSINSNSNTNTRLTKMWRPAWLLLLLCLVLIASHSSSPIFVLAEEEQGVDAAEATSTEATPDIEAEDTPDVDVPNTETTPEGAEDTPDVPETEATEATPDIPTDPCTDKPVAFITGATGSVGRLVTRQLLGDGFCVRVLTRNATKAREMFGEDGEDPKVQVLVGTLGDDSGTSAMTNAFSTSSSPITHIVFCAGGEEADYEAVNYNGIQQLAQLAVTHSKSVQSMVVISAAWVTKPYSLASLLFNTFYPNLPMARHLQGEHALRTLTQNYPHLNYVVLRAGRLVKDEDYLNNKKATPGLWYQQGDRFAFFGKAGNPGMSHTMLAGAVRTAMDVKGKYTVEVTGGGTTYLTDASIYKGFYLKPDSVPTAAEVDLVVTCHERALKECQIYALICGVLLLGIIGVSFTAKFQLPWRTRLMILIMAGNFYVLLWSTYQSVRSVADCAASLSGGGTSPIEEANIFDGSGGEL